MQAVCSSPPRFLAALGAIVKILVALAALYITVKIQTEPNLDQYSASMYFKKPARSVILCERLGQPARL